MCVVFYDFIKPIVYSSSCRKNVVYIIQNIVSNICYAEVDLMSINCFHGLVYHVCTLLTSVMMFTIEFLHSVHMMQPIVVILLENLPLMISLSLSLSYTVKVYGRHWP